MPGSIKENTGTVFMMTIPFSQANVPDAAGDMECIAIDNQISPPMPFAGSIVGISVQTNADLTGTTALTFAPTVNTVSKAANLSALLDDTHQQAYTMLRPDVIPFAAGDNLGISWTKTGTTAPTTTDAVALLFCLVYNGQN